MSDEKYIINKDSLTGIANAVRNKLGVGEATTDPQTGDIVYPKDKGYYLKGDLIAKIYGFGWSQKGYNGNFTQDHTPLINDENWNEAVGEPWYSVEITLVNVQGRLYNMDVSYTGGNQNFTNVTSSTYTVSAPNGSTYFNLYFGNKFNPNISYASSSLGSLTAIFKDAEGKPIRPKQSSYHYLWKTQLRTRNFKTGGGEIPIPLTIDDIRNKIKDYWSIPDGSLDISANGIYDVTTKASAVVNVPNSSTGSLTINANGTYDVTEKASAIVSVSPSLQTKTTTILQNGSQIITPDSNYDGLSSVNLTISVPNPSTGSLEITENGTYDVTDKASAVVNVPSSGGVGTLETWKWFDAYGTYSTFPSDFSVENLKDLTCGSGSKSYPRGLYKDSLGKPVSMKDQGISLPSSFSNIGSPLTEAKISAAHNEGRTFCIPWNWTGVKRIPEDVSFIWFVVEPNDSKIYLGAGHYINYVGNGYWAVIYT